MAVNMMCFSLPCSHAVDFGLSEWLRLAQIIAFSVGVGISIIIARKSWISKQNFDRRNAAISYSLTKNKDYLEARRAIEIWLSEYFLNSSNRQISPDTLDALTSKDDGLGKKIKFLLAHWEVMSISIVDGLIDENTCFQMVGSTLVNTIDVLEEVIVKIRSNPLDERRYDYLLIIHDQWKNRLLEEKKHGRTSKYHEYLNNGKNIDRIKRSLVKGRGQ